MGLENHRDTLKRARVVVECIRGLRTQMQRDAATIANEKFTPAYQQEHKQKIREAAKVKAAEYSSGTTAELAVALADKEQWTRQSIIRRAARFTTAPAEQPLLTSDRAVVALLSDVREELTAQRWLLQAPQLSTTELIETFTTELPRRHFAICAVLLREADRRAEQNQRTITTATDEDITAGQDVRALPLRLRAHLNAVNMPEFAATDAVFVELAEVSGYLDDAVGALDTDDDGGARRQTITELQRSGATNDQIRDALAANAA